jgi:hypothetical protein
MIRVHVHDLDDVSEQLRVDGSAGPERRLRRGDGRNGPRERDSPGFERFALGMEDVDK